MTDTLNTTTPDSNVPDNARAPIQLVAEANPQGKVRNYTFEELQIGDSATLTHTVTRQDVELFAVASGDYNPQHLDDEFASRSLFKSVIAHGMYGGSLISALLGTRFPGSGTIYLSQSLRFTAPVRIGDTITVKLTVSARNEEKKWITLESVCTNQKGKTVIAGEATVMPPAESAEMLPHPLPDVKMFKRQNGPERLLAEAQQRGRIKMGVVHPCDPISLEAALKARDLGLIEPLLIAPRAKLEAVAAEAGLSLEGVKIEDVPHSHAAAVTATQLARAGLVEALMKGSLHTDELMSAIVDREHGLRTKRRISHCFLLQAPAYPRPFIITDAAVNIQPSLAVKADIVQNAINLAHVIGVEQPKVALLAAVETVNAEMEATLHAAALCKMADRGQITGGVLDGPLAFDNAVSAEAARIKGISSPVAGEADILVVPDLESGNMLAKQLEYLAGAHMAGIVVGAKLPIVLTSRADSEDARISSAALAVLLAHQYRLTPP